MHLVVQVVKLCVGLLSTLILVKGVDKPYMLAILSQACMYA